MRRSSAVAKMREREIVFYESDTEERIDRTALMSLIFEMLDLVRTTESAEKEDDEKC